MKLLSVNVGLPREVVAGNELVLTSIFKSAVTSRVPIRNSNLLGDQQSDFDDWFELTSLFTSPHLSRGG